MIKTKLTLLFFIVIASFITAQPEKENKRDKEQIPFSFDQKPLIEIIEFVAQKKGVNVILPQNQADADVIKKQTVSYQPLNTETVSLKTAWQMVHTFLEMSGFSLFPRAKKMYAITRNKPNEPDVMRQPLPLYVNVAPYDLPNNDERIRYIYYLRNVQAPTTEDNPIAIILKEMLSPGAVRLGEPKSNALILSDKATHIASAMNIITELDSSGFRETIEVIPLYNIPVNEVLRVFNLLKKAAGEEEAKKASPFIRADQRGESVTYFAADTKFVADVRTNSLIVMGRETAINRISEFIREYMDVLPESGKSILHVYDLQYLDAQEFAKVLSAVVKPLAVAEAAQAAQGPAGGAERFFTGVSIEAEVTKEIEPTLAAGRVATEAVTLATVSGGGNLEGAGIQGKIRTGGNRLIIAALQDDWLRLKTIIERLDRPQPQVILEVMIVDFTAVDQKIVGGDIRNATNMFQNDQGISFLATHLSPPANVLPQLAPGGRPLLAFQQGLAQDLLGLLSTASNPADLTSLLAPGSLIVSFNDPATPGISGLIQILQSILQTRILSHPYLITTNNQKATIASQELRRTRGPALPGPSGVVTIRIEDIPATVQVQMIPRLSSLDRLSLQVAVDINEFRGATLTRITRRVNTNANLNSGQILVIGGLTRVNSIDDQRQTPFLAQIPLLGYFFKRTNTITEKSNLAIFISPTIIHPKLRAGMDLYTIDKIRKSRRDISDEVIFGDNRDPIVHVFFTSEQPGNEMVQDYLAHASNAPEFEQIKTKRERLRETRRPRKRPTPAPKKPVTKETAVTELVA